MAYPTVVMDSKVSRKLLSIDSSWSTPQILDALLLALNGEGPALSTTRTSFNEVEGEIALVVSTSGSTGDAKLVAHSANSLIANARACHKYVGAKIGERWSLLLPTSHIAGINVLIRAIELGTTPVGVETKADFTAIVPTQLHRALNGDSVLLHHLQGCKQVLVGGAPLNGELRKAAENHEIKVVETYGATETCGGVIYDGKPLDGVEVKLIDGKVALKGPQLALSYLGQGGIGVDGWFITSDLGEMRDGKLKILGRSDDQIISGGEKISLSAVDGFLQSEFAHPGIVAFSKIDPEWGERLCIATTKEIPASLISGKLKERFGNHVSPKEILSVSEIPYLSIGKPDRKRLAHDNS